MDARSFGRAVEALRQWRTHREAEIDLCPRCPAIEEGTVIGQLVRVGPLYAIACCRIVRVVNEEDRFGFAYGTLPAQPERGEEAFIVTHEAHRVRFEITAFSRPRHPLARLGGPVTRAVQDRVSQRYLNGVRNYLKEP